MARLKKSMYETMHATDLKNPVIFVVDMVEGFVNEGALHDKEIGKITPSIIQLMEKLECKNVFVCDSHPPKTREFEAFPAHCCIGSKEADVIKELQPYIKRVIKKNSTNAFVSPEFQEFLQDAMRYYNDIIITGCCTDLCILQFVLGLHSYLNEHNMTDYRIIVPANCTETYDSPIHDATIWNEMALENMRMNGVCVVKNIE